MLLFLLIAVVFVLDRLTKALALMWPMYSFPLVSSLLTFDPAVNNRGPLGIPIPFFLFLSLSLMIAAVIFFLVWSEPAPINRSLLAGVLLGVVSNSFDRFKFGHIVDVFRLAGGMSFNLADVLIVTCLAGIFIQYRKQHVL